MTHPGNQAPFRTTDGSAFSERLTLPWWLWPPALGATAVLAAEIGLGAPGVRSWLPYVLLLPLVIAGLSWLGRIRTVVTKQELRVDDARLPREVIADVIALGAAGRQRLLGPDADPLAFVIQRPWISGAVQVVINDPEDSTPYWVISSRHPQELAEALLSPAPRR